MTDAAGNPDSTIAVPRGKAAHWQHRIFGSREYWWLWVAQVVSAFGDWIGFFAITALAAAISDAPETAIALVITARVAPSVLLAPVIGVVIDRFDRKKLMMIADVARAGVFCCLPFIRTVTGLVVASLLLEVFTLIWGPSKEALVPSIVPPEKLASANSLGLVAAYGTMPIAGLMQFALKKGNDALAGFTWLKPLQFNSAELGETQALAFYVDALSFLMTAFIVWWFVLRRRPEAGAAPTERVAGGWRKTINDIREGWHFIFMSRVIRSVHVGLAAGIFGGAMLIPLGPLFARDVLGDPDTFALFITFLGVGVAIGVSVVSATQTRIPKASVFVLALFGAGVALTYSVSMASFWLSAIGVTVLGVCAGFVYVLGFTLLHENTEDEFRGRIFSTLIILVRMCVLLSLWLGPVMSAVFDSIVRRATDTPTKEVPKFELFGLTISAPGSRLALWLAGGIIILASLAAARSMRVGIRASMRDIRSNVSATGHSAASHEPGGDSMVPVDPAIAGSVGEEASEFAETIELNDDNDEGRSPSPPPAVANP